MYGGGAQYVGVWRMTTGAGTTVTAPAGGRGRGAMGAGTTSTGVAATGPYGWLADALTRIPIRSTTAFAIPTSLYALASE